MNIQLAEMTHASLPDDNWDGVTFAIHTNPDADVSQPGDVRTYCTERRCEGMPRVITSPDSLREQIAATLKPGVRAMLGNAGCELTFRHITKKPHANVRAMLLWAEEAYSLVGEQLVLSPMDYDLIHDVMTGGRLLAWAAAHRTPLAIFCGYRFLFPEDAFTHIRQVCARHPMQGFCNPYRYPYTQVAHAISHSRAELWTGTGFHEGLAVGAMEKAADFGFAIVFTTREAWIHSTL